MIQKQLTNQKIFIKSCLLHLSTLVTSYPLRGSKYRPNFEQRYLESDKGKYLFERVFNNLSNHTQVERLFVIDV